MVEEPLEKLAAKVGILTSLIASRLEGVEPAYVEGAHRSWPAIAALIVGESVRDFQTFSSA